MASDHLWLSLLTFYLNLSEFGSFFFISLVLKISQFGFRSHRLGQLRSFEPLRRAVDLHSWCVYYHRSQILRFFRNMRVMGHRSLRKGNRSDLSWLAGQIMLSSKACYSCIHWVLVWVVGRRIKILGEVQNVIDLLGHIACLQSWQSLNRFICLHSCLESKIWWVNQLFWCLLMSLGSSLIHI